MRPIALKEKFSESFLVLSIFSIFFLFMKPPKLCRDLLTSLHIFLPGTVRLTFNPFFWFFNSKIKLTQIRSKIIKKMLRSHQFTLTKIIS